jgi:RND family efflux transporter MFP subunit
MRTNAPGAKKSRKKLFVIILVLLILAGGGGTGYYFWQKAQIVNAQADTTTTNTAQVRRGNLTLSATGSGVLVAGEQADLAFPVSGKVGAVYVSVGDIVTEGQVLAELADQTTLNAALTSARLELELAQRSLEALTINAPTSLANARIALAEAEKALKTAKSSVKKEGYTRCDPTVTQVYLNQYESLKEKFEALDAVDGDSTYYLNVLLPAKNAMNKALGTYNYCLGYSDYEIATSQAEVVVDQAAYDAAKLTLDTLDANNGIDPIELAKAQNAVAEAQIAFERARQNVEGAVLKAPFAGTVLAVAGEPGDVVGTEAFISLIDLNHPEISFSADETDLSLVKRGAKAIVVFDALPDLTFEGTVLRVNPTLNSNGGYQVLSGVIELDPGDDIGNTYLIEGLNASVEIISGETQNALLVPLEAVRDIGDGQYAVFVVGADGSLTMRVVEVGLMDATYAEIKNGLELGETVSTGAVETFQ